VQVNSRGNRLGKVRGERGDRKEKKWSSRLLPTRRWRTGEEGGGGEGAEQNSFLSLVFFVERRKRERKRKSEEYETIFPLTVLVEKEGRGKVLRRGKRRESPSPRHPRVQGKEKKREREKRPI